MIGFFQPGTRRGIRGMTMGSLKTVPPRAFRIVPLGESHTGSCQYRSAIKIEGEQTLLQIELLHSLLIRCDGSTLHTNRVFLNGLGRINRNLIIGLIPILQPQIVVLQIDV